MKRHLTQAHRIVAAIISLSFIVGDPALRLAAAVESRHEHAVSLETLATESGFKGGASRSLQLREDVEQEYGDLFGEKQANGRTVDVGATIAKLSREMGAQFEKVLSERREFLSRVEDGTAEYGFLKDTDEVSDQYGTTMTVGQIRKGMLDNFRGIKSKEAWRLKPAPKDATRPGLQGTGPADDMGMLMGQINAGADGAASWMDDGEDARPKDKRVYQMIRNLMEVFDGKWDGKTFVHPIKKDDETGEPKTYAIETPWEKRPTMFLRVPGLHLKSDIKVDGKNVPEMISQMVTYAVNMHDKLKSRNYEGIYFYVPKIETPEEAVVVAKLVSAVESAMDLPRGIIRIEMLNERIRYTANQEVIMWVLRHWLIGPNVGRWDYINSRMEMSKDSPDGVFPDPYLIKMTDPTMTAYTRRNALLTLLAGGFPVGGMAAVMARKIPKDAKPEVRDALEKVNARAERAVWFDKVRERLTGLMEIEGKKFDAYRQSWVATIDKEYVIAGAEPLQASLEDFQSKVLPKLSGEELQQLKSLGLLDPEGKIQYYAVTAEDLRPENLWGDKAWKDLTTVPKGKITEESVRRSMYFASEYLFQLLNGNYAAAIDDPWNGGTRLMNDLATYEIFWHWLKTLVDHEVTFEGDGKLFPKGQKVTMTKDVMRQFLKERSGVVDAFFADMDRKGKKSPFDRSLSPVTMDILERQLMHPRWIQYGSRVAIVVMDKNPMDREQILNAIFSDSRVDVAAKVKAKECSEYALQAFDFVYDVFDGTDHYPSDKLREKQEKALSLVRAAEREEEEFEREVAETEKWMNSDRFKHTVRRHTARDVVRLRPRSRNKHEYTNDMSGKFYQGLRQRQENFKNGVKPNTISTWGPIDGGQATIAAQQGMEAIYVSGWQASLLHFSTGRTQPDLAKYPYDTVPLVVQRITHHQRWKDAQQRLARSKMTPEERRKTPAVDYLLPIYADADTGHQAVAELMDLFIEAGAAAAHFEDQVHGKKKCGHMAGKVLCSTQEHQLRLMEARATADLMGSEILLVARTDSEAAKLLENDNDPVDHWFILGTSNRDIPPLRELVHLAWDPNLGDLDSYQIRVNQIRQKFPVFADAIENVWELKKAGKSDEAQAKLEALTAEWSQQAKLKTYYQAVADAIKASDMPDKDAKLERWSKENNKYAGFSHGRQEHLARELGIELYWDKNKARVFEGYFQIKPGVDLAVHRGRSFAPYADILWMEQEKPILEEAEHFATGVHEKFPDQLLAVNNSPSFNWDNPDLHKGLTPEQIDAKHAAHVKAQGDMGYQFQFITLAGSHISLSGAAVFQKAFGEEGMLAYVRDVQRMERENGVSYIRHQEYAGSPLKDAMEQLVYGGASSTGIGGKGLTEKQFDAVAKVVAVPKAINLQLEGPVTPEEDAAAGRVIKRLLSQPDASNAFAVHAKKVDPDLGTVPVRQDPYFDALATDVAMDMNVIVIPALEGHLEAAGVRNDFIMVPGRGIHQTGANVYISQRRYDHLRSLPNGVALFKQALAHEAEHLKDRAADEATIEGRAVTVDVRAAFLDQDIEESVPSVADMRASVAVENGLYTGLGNKYGDAFAKDTADKVSVIAINVSDVNNAVNLRNTLAEYSQNKNVRVMLISKGSKTTPDGKVVSAEQVLANLVRVLNLREGTDYHAAVTYEELAKNKASGQEMEDVLISFAQNKFNAWAAAKSQSINAVNIGFINSEEAPMDIKSTSPNQGILQVTPRKPADKQVTDMRKVIGFTELALRLRQVAGHEALTLAELETFMDPADWAAIQSSLVMVGADAAKTTVMDYLTTPTAATSSDERFNNTVNSFKGVVSAA